MELEFKRLSFVDPVDQGDLVYLIVAGKYEPCEYRGRLGTDVTIIFGRYQMTLDISQIYVKKQGENHENRT